MMASLGEAARHALEAAMDPAKWVYKSDFARKYIAEGRAEALLDLLAARDFVVTDAQRRAVLACTDEALLKRWFVAALTATSTDEILAVV